MNVEYVECQRGEPPSAYGLRSELGAAGPAARAREYMLQRSTSTFNARFNVQRPTSANSFISTFLQTHTSSRKVAVPHMDGLYLAGNLLILRRPQADGNFLRRGHFFPFSKAVSSSYSPYPPNFPFVIFSLLLFFLSFPHYLASRRTLLSE